MQKKKIICFAILCALIFVPTSNLLSKTKANPNWQKFISGVGKFSVLMPSNPVYSKKSDHSPVGTIGENIYTYKGKTLLLTAEYSDLPSVAVIFGGHNKIYNDAEKSFLKDVRGKEISYKELKMDAYNGREFVYKSPKRQGKVHFFLIGKRFYVLQASTTKILGDIEAIDKYLKSFQTINNKK